MEKQRKRNIVGEFAKCFRQKIFRSDEGLTLETSAFESLYGGQFTVSTQLIKPNYLTDLYAFDAGVVQFCEALVNL